jgi:transposase
MSLPEFSTQQSLFGRATRLSELFAPDSRFRLFAEKIYPLLVGARPQLAACYCADNGRSAVEPVLVLGVSLLQFLENVPDRPALEQLQYHAGWNFALNRHVGDPLFDASVLVRFRQRLLAHQQETLAFSAILEGLQAAGLVVRGSRQRLDSTFVMGRLARMNSLECTRETLRLALEELAKRAGSFGKPAWWSVLCERYVEGGYDYKSGEETLRAKLQQAGADALTLWQWVSALSDARLACGPKTQLLKRVLEEHFELVEGGAVRARAGAVPGALNNPHEPDAQWAAKGQGRHKKEVVGYKLQVAETVPEAPRQQGEPTAAFLTAMETQPAIGSDDAGFEQVEAAQAQRGQAPASAWHVDGAYVSAERLAQMKAQGRALIGPAQPAPKKEGRFSAEDFDVHIAERRAVCPAGHPNTQCSQLTEEKTGRVQYRFEWSTHCHDCPLRENCLGKDQRHRTLVVGEHHDLLQARRREQITEAFAAQQHKRNAIEGTGSELVRAHGARQARYRGLPKMRLQNYFIGGACNAKRWIRRLQWEIQQATTAVAGAVAVAPSG